MEEDSNNPDGLCYNVSLRKTRQGSECSMSSQRLDEIVGALMRPIKDLKQNFDMDINSLLEEYLTEAGLRQLDEGRSPIDDTLPNFAEVALLLQQSANIYSKKVDYLWIKVVEIVQSFGSGQDNVNDPDRPEEADKDAKRSSKKSKRKEVEVHNFEVIDLEEATNINVKENSDPKPLAVLPRNFIEFEPRIITKNDIQIKDYKGDGIGVSTDFRCNWNTDQGGMLCDDLDFCYEKEPLDMCAMGVTGTAMSSPPDSGHYSDYCTDGHTPVYDDTFTSPHSEREYPDSLLENSEIPNSTMNETTLLNETTDTTLLQDTLLDATLNTSVVDTSAVLEKCKKRKASDGTLSLVKKKSKYDMEHQIVGTSHLFKLKPTCFELPKAMIKNVVECRVNKLRKLRRKLGKYDVDKRTLDSQYFLDTFIANYNAKHTAVWHRRQILKELSVLATDWEKDFHGFPDYDSKEDKDGFCGFDADKTEQLHSNYSRNKILYSVAIAKAIESPYDDTSCDNRENDKDCDTTQSIEHHADEDSHHCDGYEADDDRRDSTDTLKCDDKVDAITRRLNAEAALEKGNLKCSKEQLEITQRVEEWHTSIKSELVRAERRKMFDLWTYSSKVLSSFSKNRGPSTPVITFNDVMKDKPKEDRARYFLATLMLANSQNVDIIETDPVACVDFNMQLLSMERRATDDDFTC